MLHPDGQIHFKCGCGKKYKVPPEHGGRKFKCRACGHPAIVPALEREAPPDDGTQAVTKEMPDPERTPPTPLPAAPALAEPTLADVSPPEPLEEDLPTADEAPDEPAAPAVTGPPAIPRWARFLAALHAVSVAVAGVFVIVIAATQGASVAFSLSDGVAAPYLDAATAAAPRTEVSVEWDMEDGDTVPRRRIVTTRKGPASVRNAPPEERLAVETVRTLVPAVGLVGVGGWVFCALKFSGAILFLLRLRLGYAALWAICGVDAVLLAVMTVGDPLGPASAGFVVNALSAVALKIFVSPDAFRAR